MAHQVLDGRAPFTRGLNGHAHPAVIVLRVTPIVCSLVAVVVFASVCRPWLWRTGRRVVVSIDVVAGNRLLPPLDHSRLVPTDHGRQTQQFPQPRHLLLEFGHPLVVPRPPAPPNRPLSFDQRAQSLGRPHCLLSHAVELPPDLLHLGSEATVQDLGPKDLGLALHLGQPLLVQPGSDLPHHRVELLHVRLLAEVQRQPVSGPEDRVQVIPEPFRTDVVVNVDAVEDDGEVDALGQLRHLREATGQTQVEVPGEYGADPEVDQDPHDPQQALGPLVRDFRRLLWVDHHEHLRAAQDAVHDGVFRVVVDQPAGLLQLGRAVVEQGVEPPQLVPQVVVSGQQLPLLDPLAVQERLAGEAHEVQPAVAFLLPGVDAFHRGVEHPDHLSLDLLLSRAVFRRVVR